MAVRTIVMTAAAAMALSSSPAALLAQARAEIQTAAYGSRYFPEDAILAKGFAAYMDGKDKQALSYFEEVVRINPRNQAAQQGLAKVKSRLKKQHDVDAAKANGPTLGLSASTVTDTLYAPAGIPYTNVV